MRDKHRVIISSQTLYKEVELSVENQVLTVGTNISDDIRLMKQHFFENIQIMFNFDGGNWSVICADNLYLSTGDIRKLMTKSLTHGDVIELCYQKSGVVAFVFEFLIDFDNDRRKYERMINMGTASSLSIGTQADNDIVIASNYVINDRIIFNKSEEGQFVTVENSTYGVYHNGKKTSGSFAVDNKDFISVSDFSFYYDNNNLWTEISDRIVINELTVHDYPEKNNYPKFNRNTRIRVKLDDNVIEVLDPPAKPQKPKNDILTRLLPSMGMLLAAGVMMYFGGAMIIFAAISGTMAIVTTIIRLVQSKKEYRENTVKRIETYNKYIEAKRAEIETCRQKERAELEDIYISDERIEQYYTCFSADLFDRMIDDDDFLAIRLGTGEVEATRVLNYKKQERLEYEDELQQIPEQLYEEYKYIDNAPVACDLKENNAIAIIGTKERRYEMLKKIIIDVIARHYHSDIQLFFIAEEAHKDDVLWLRFLPHVYNRKIDMRNIVIDNDSKNLVFEFLYKELTRREAVKQFDNQIIVFFYDYFGFKSHPISKFIDKAQTLGVTFIFFSEHKAEIPLGCNSIIELTEDEQGILKSAENRNQQSSFSYHLLNDYKARDIVRLTAPVYTEEISLEGTLTKNYSMFEMLNIFSVEDLLLGARWRSSKVYNSLSAPVGISKSGIVNLDLHDTADGPHGLVAGTTGSGKSEILQTYILAMATLYHPYEVAFVIIDFKGGGMVNQFVDLPHLLGAITNIDGREIERSLKSLKAELQKRQRLFAEADVNHIDKYIKKYKAGELNEALPHLIVIVDEFAELKAEQPEFMKELISAARIGRSLGVHLILATQKPSGQINEQIWSNSRFKLCLKVQSQQDSNEVLKSPLAAEIKEPGRAYLQVGNNEKFELFQSAYSGASEKIDDSKTKTFTIFELTESGKKRPVYEQKKAEMGDDNLTQLDAIVKHIAAYCQANKLVKLPDICLESLAHTIDFPTIDRKPIEVHDAISATIGVYDDPDKQFQGTYKINIGSDNTLIVGSAQTGKTNILQGIIRSLATEYTPEQVSIYIIDFSSMVLKNFEGLNHVGGVVTPSQDEKFKNLIRLLQNEIETRKEKLLSVGVSSFTAYREAGMQDLPLIVLMIDNLTTLKELYLQDDDSLINICREGLSVGISTIIANTQTAGIGYKYLSNFATRIALFNNDSAEYSTLFDYCKLRIDDIAGRCIVDIDKTHLECQTYLSFKGEKEIDRANSIRSFIDSVNQRNENIKARLIPAIPDILTEEYIAENYGNLMKQRFSVVFGLDYSTVMPFVLDFSSIGLLGISGAEKSGKHNWLNYLFNQFEQFYPNQVAAYVVDGVNRKSQFLKQYSSLVDYSLAAEKACQYIKKIEVECQRRYEKLMEGDANLLSESKLQILLLDNIDAVTAIANDTEALNAYRNITTRYKKMNVAIIISAIENVNIPYSANEIMKAIKDKHQLLYFDNIDSIKIYDIAMPYIRRFSKRIETGDCYYTRDGECVKIKTALVSRKRTIK